MKQKRYTTSFREEAVGIVLVKGMSIKDAAESLGVKSKTLYSWVKAKRLSIEQTKGASPGPQSVYDELAATRKELARVKEINAILKKATAYFASPLVKGTSG